MAGAPSSALLVSLALSYPGKSWPIPWARPLSEEPPPTLQMCVQMGRERPLCLVLGCREDTHPFLWWPACPARRRLGPALAPPFTSSSPFSALSYCLLCLSPFQGFVSLQGTQVTELLPDPEDPGKHLFEITPGKPRVPMCAEGVLVAPWGQDCAPAFTILSLAGQTLSPS